MQRRVRADRQGAGVAGRGLGQRGAVHDLPGALAGHPALHAVAPARVPAPVPQRRLPAQHAPRHRPSGRRAVPHRGTGDRGAVGRALARSASCVFTVAASSTRRIGLTWYALAPAARQLSMVSFSETTETMITGVAALAAEARISPNTAKPP